MSEVSTIALRQNSPESITLMRAIAVAHRRAQWSQAGSLLISIVVAALSVLATGLRPAATAIALLGAAWAAIYALVVVPWSRRRLGLAAVLQEMYDSEVLRLPWNAVVAGEPLSAAQVSQLSRAFHGREDNLRDYYLVAASPYPTDMLFCLEQNLAWGPRVRRRYARLMASMVVLWCAVGVIVGLVRQLTLATLLSSWFVPSLGLLLLCLDIYRAQTGVTRERERVLGILRARQAEPAGRYSEKEWTAFARQVADTIFHSRQQQPRVPNWFFRRFHDKDRDDFAVEMRRIEQVRDVR